MLFQNALYIVYVLNLNFHYLPVFVLRITGKSVYLEAIMIVFGIAPFYIVQRVTPIC